jgi:NAD(P)-dependent dehydrogenase (short-subunit alcohol dehydrogenase family)
VTHHDVIVTGATGKVGRAVVRHFQSEGREVLEVSRLGGMGWDLTDPNRVHELFEDHQAPYLVNCFAMNDNMTDDHRGYLDIPTFAKYMEVNVTALYNVCREWSRRTILHCADQALVNFSSIYGVVSPDPDCYAGMGAKSPGYCVSKAAVIGLTKYLATHLVGIRANCIVLGALYDSKLPDKFIERMESRHPTRIFGEAHEVTGLVDYLCSKRSRFMNGSIITLDGGFTTT